MELWDRLSGFLLRLIDDYDDQAIFLLMFLEETGIPLPLPGDVYMLLAGYRAALGKMNMLWALFLLESATIIGASILYWLAARGGRPLLYRYGRYIRLDRAKLDHAEHWMQDRAMLAVFLGRIIPGLRNVSVLAAGVFGVPYYRFLPPFALGSFLYICFFFFLGFWVGPQALEVIGAPRLSLRIVVTAVLFVALGAFLIVMYRRAAPVRQLAREPAPEVRKLETSAMAGFLATLQMGMGVNIALYGLSALGLRVPERALLQLVDQAAERSADGNSVRFVAIMLAVLVLSGLIWAVIYSHVAVPLLPIPPWLRGLVFSLLPLTFSVLILMPLSGAGFFGIGLEAGLWPLAGEVLRNALFGVGLATSYSLLRVARQLPARAAQMTSHQSMSDA